MLPLRKLHSAVASANRIWSVAWSHSGDILASCGEDRTLKLWLCSPDQRWDCRYTVPSCHKRSVRRVAWSPCDNYLASSSFDGTIVIWKLSKRPDSVDLEALVTLEGHTSEVKCVAWSSSGRLIASCGRDKSVWFWEFDEEEDVQCVSVLQPHRQDVKAVTWHPFEEILASCSYDDTINLYKEELDDWVVAVQLTGHSSTVWNVQFSPSGDILASCSADHSIRLWTVITGADKFKRSNWMCVATLTGYHTDTVFDLAWSPDGQMLSTCGADNRVCVFRLPDEGLVTQAGKLHFSEPLTLWAHNPNAHTEDVNCVQWQPVVTKAGSGETTPNDFYLCTAGDDGVISFWVLPAATSSNASASSTVV
ncbi:unnamed protein product [Dicrocoelium dendriticum]|nr:unnamed protein product [Dicrocoelium dendriticum]